MKIINTPENNGLKTSADMLHINTNDLNNILSNEDKKIKKESKIFVERYVDKYGRF